MKGLPKKIRVHPHDLDLVPGHEILRAAPLVGQYLGDEARILYDENVSRTQIRDTLVHESLHAMWAQTALDITYDDDAADGPGELIISVLAPRILAWIRDNPTLMATLREA